MQITRMRKGIPITSDSAMKKILSKGAKGFITSISKKTVEYMKYYTKANLYDRDLVGTKRHYYNNSGYLYGSIQATRTDYSGDSYYSEVGFDNDYLRAHSSKPKFKKSKRGKKVLIEFGRYTDIYGNYVGDDMIEDEWIEDGTGKPSIVPRKGAYIMEDVIQSVENDFGVSNVQTTLSKELGRVVVERIK